MKTKGNYRYLFVFLIIIQLFGKNAKELIETVLSKHETSASSSAEKQIKFTITKA